jgi:hypothetical protein
MLVCVVMVLREINYKIIEADYTKIKFLCIHESIKSQFPFVNACL